MTWMATPVAMADIAQQPNRVLQMKKGIITALQVRAMKIDATTDSRNWHLDDRCLPIALTLMQLTQQDTTQCNTTQRNKA
jgi:hypothetical protein